MSSSEWVKFRASLTKGAKRSLPRATRFIFLELALLARDRSGEILLAPGMKDVDAVHDLLGGNRREVADALRQLGTVLPGDEDPLVAFVDDGHARYLVIPSWNRENAPPKEKPGASTERSRRHRANAHATAVAPPFRPPLLTAATDQQRTGDDRSSGEERREEKNAPSERVARAHARLPDGHLTADAIAAELAAHHRLAQLATDPEFPSTLLSRAMGKGTKAEWLADAIADAAADTPAGEQAHATMKRVRAYCDRARPPRRDGDEARPLATDPPAPPKLPAGTGRLPPPMPLPERVVQPRFHGAATSPGQSAPNPAPDDHADAGNPSTPGRALRVPPTAISDLLANMPRPSGEP